MSCSVRRFSLVPALAGLFLAISPAVQAAPLTAEDVQGQFDVVVQGSFAGAMDDAAEASVSTISEPSPAGIVLLGLFFAVAGGVVWPRRAYANPTA